MKVNGFDGRERSINFSKYYVYGDDTRHKSKLHKKAKKILREVFPYDSIYEEVSLPGSNKGSSSILRADFFIPNQNLIVEIHGQQHYEFTVHFHKIRFLQVSSQRQKQRKLVQAKLNKICCVKIFGV